jgi:GNAT superfamily N-acetyltransferase
MDDIDHSRASATGRLLRPLLRLLRRCGFDYSCFRVYRLSAGAPGSSNPPPLPAGYRVAELSPVDVRGCKYAEIRDCEWYGGPGSFAFGVFDRDGTPVCAQWFWVGERYRAGNFWPLGATEAASMHLVTAPHERGKGLATHLKIASAESMRRNGFGNLYSRIWWTHRRSIRVSEKAGWSHIGTVLDVSVPGRSRPFRFVRRA